MGFLDLNGLKFCFLVVALGLSCFIFFQWDLLCVVFQGWVAWCVAGWLRVFLRAVLVFGCLGLCCSAGTYLPQKYLPRPYQ
jgi:hypothetical protein